MNMYTMTYIYIQSLNYDTSKEKKSKSGNAVLSRQQFWNSKLDMGGAHWSTAVQLYFQWSSQMYVMVLCISDKTKTWLCTDIK